MTTDTSDEVLKFVLFQSKHIRLYNLPSNLLNQLKTGNGIEEQVECIWSGTIKLIREINRDNGVANENEDKKQSHTIPAFTQHRLKLEYINDANSQSQKLWGETWYVPINKSLKAELGLRPDDEDVDTEVETSKIKMEQIKSVANDGTDTIRELSYELGIVSTQWFRVVVQLPDSGFHPLIEDGSGTASGGNGPQVALLLRFKHDIDSEEFIEQLENYNMRFDHLQRQYYYDKWAEILDQDTVSNEDVKSKESGLDPYYEDLSLSDNENNYEAKDKQSRVSQSSESEDDDFGDFISK
ncbi:hypothetical protein CANMA_003972 [Candida margitis]|uniref:uncharacterized protein n=1 Tax=Candida margitis TaxID=1775924 RepID=UPI002226915B|nr:uncharacterized protein CANMA_003972 [Candida margitis]KAI5960710.1 hypothetical protein CANMA_003972 [Candida margitis]